MEEQQKKILHIFVVGFHHKKGCQIEFSYPELEVLPDEWKNLSSLAMPDGAHNYQQDSVYFHLPSLTDPNQTVFGVSCFQQIAVENVKKKTSDMTRGAVQKAVCLLSTIPFYGYLQVKMELVTEAFFEKGDFTEYSLLTNAYHHLNDCIPEISSQHLYEGLSARELVLRFRHKTLLLFKLLLLERRVVFFHSPVKPLCCSILSLMSLHPGLIQDGLYKSCCVNNRMKPEEMEIFADQMKNSVEDGSNLGGDVNELKPDNDSCENARKENDGPECNLIENQVKESISVNNVEEPSNTNSLIQETEKVKEDDSEAVDALLFGDYLHDIEGVGDNQMNPSQLLAEEATEITPSEFPSVRCDIAFLSNVNLANCGLPLSIFTKGNFCLPYLCITDLDFISSKFVRGYHGGAANVLFKQKKQCADVLIEIENCKIEIRDPDLRRQLFLTTEDLRFIDQLIRCVFETRDSVVNSISEEGSEDWIRAQFTFYLLSLLRTSLLEDGSKEMDHYNIHFINAWKGTNNYKTWLSGDHSGIWDLNPGHPYAGSLSVADMKLRFSQALSSSESGRKINQVVLTTGRAVGGAITNARGALSNWWSSLTTSEQKVD